MGFKPSFEYHTILTRSNFKVHDTLHREPLLFSFLTLDTTLLVPPFFPSFLNLFVIQSLSSLYFSIRASTRHLRIEGPRSAFCKPAVVAKRRESPSIPVCVDGGEGKNFYLRCSVGWRGRGWRRSVCLSVGADVCGDGMPRYDGWAGKREGHVCK
ncbi:hypothetical protein DL98DRAFT_1063 [Cadophora sp. DSE1049]|nr:hypothetical protein DL98DRAFT_1063 [Cadophora sp. DSE1049]